MRVDQEYQALVLNNKELDAIREHLGMANNVLAFPLSAEETPAMKGPAITQWESLSQKDRELYAGGILALNDPLQVASIAYTLSDQRIFRSTLAWSGKDSEIVASLSPQDEDLVLALRTPQDIQIMLNEVLATHSSLWPANVNVGMSATASILMLAVFDCVREAHYLSLLTHTSPNFAYTLPEVLARLQNANNGDYRWPLSLFASLIPSDLLTSFSKDEIMAGLVELEGAGWLLRLDDEKEKPDLPLFMVSGPGEMIANGFLYDISKAVLMISNKLSDGTIGHEAFMLVRDSRFLWLVDVGGKVSTVANLTVDEWKDFSKTIINPSGLISESPVPKVMEDVSKSIPCPRCGAEISAGKKFCTRCGTALQTGK